MAKLVTNMQLVWQQQMINDFAALDRLGPTKQMPSRINNKDPLLQCLTISMSMPHTLVISGDIETNPGPNFSG